MLASFTIVALSVDTAAAQPVRQIPHRASSAASATGTLLAGESFAMNATAPNAWAAFGHACLTAGNASTPATSLPACVASAVPDRVGQGALQLTSSSGAQYGMAVLRTALPTARGLQITFTDYAYNGTQPGADGMAFFLTDASAPLPSHAGQPGGELGYAGSPASGIQNAYVGVGLDEFGNFSARAGAPGPVPETIAVRGAAATSYAYLGGVTDTAGKAASLPFALDLRATKVRPAGAPTIRAILTPAGELRVAVDRHDGSGFVTYYDRTIVGIAGEPAVPAKVFFGFTASTGSRYNIHEVNGLVVSALAPATPVATLANEPFTFGATTPGLWNASGDACLTAGGAATPSGSVPACRASAPLDPAGAGALQLTPSGIPGQSGMVIEKTPLPTAGGLVITFTDYAFHGTTPAGADGLAFFLTDAAHPLPAHAGQNGGNLAYAGSLSGGLPNAYIGIGLDEYGEFSSVAGGPGRTPETIAVRGAAATNYQYIGGATDATGKAASLPFSFDQPASVSRPAVAPAIRATLTAGGTLSVAIDRHDGAGFSVYYTQSIVGVGGQPAVPAHVYFGLSASDGSRINVHQIRGLTITTAGSPVNAAADNPPELVSTNGSLVLHLIAQLDPATGRPQFVVDGSPVPPTLRLLPGDTFVVNLTNALPAPPAGSGYTNATNLHYHGLHVSPQAPGDDSIDMLAAPGQSLHYSLQIPVNHPPGLYWYHAHVHGEAERQTLAGMSGALIIDGISAYTPQVAPMVERVLIARDAMPAGQILPSANAAQLYAMRWAMQHGVTMHAWARANALLPSASRAATSRSELRAGSTNRTRNPYALVDPNYRRFVRTQAVSSHCVAASPERPVRALTLNGRTQASIRIAPGERQFWRMVNAGADTYLDVAVDRTQLQIVALDGVPLSAGIGTPAALTVSHWLLPPGSRAEFVVTGPPAGAPAYLRTNCFDSGPAGAAMPAAVLASVDPTASGAEPAARRAAVARIAPAARRYRFHTAAAIRAAAISASRTMYYSDQNTINGVAFDPAAPPQFYAQSGTVEEWTIQNNSAQVHTFHIHQVHFVVEAIDGIVQAQQFVMDNVNVPAATANGPGNVKLLLDFTDPAVIGTFLLHCHILSHEDGGMMAKIRVGAAPPLRLSSANVTFATPSAGVQSVAVSGGAAPYSVSGCGGVTDAAVSGSAISLLPAAAGTCVLTVADASTPGITATVVVTVNAGAPVLTLAPTTVSFAAPDAAATQVVISGGVTPYSAAGCTNVAAASIIGGSIRVVPRATGTCSFTIKDAGGAQALLPVAVNAPVGGGMFDNLTFHGGNARLGWYQHETVLTTANVNSTNFGALASLAAPAGMPPLGKVHAQPLYVTNETAVDGRAHNLIIAAGAAGQVYAFDETTHAVVWHRSFTNPAAGIRQQLWSDTGCADVNPDVGIIGTPTIDRLRNALYVVVATMENGVAYTRLHALGLGAGSDLVAPAVITGSVALATGGTASISSVGNMNRTALLEANGNIYVGLGSHCDQNAANIHGWVIAYDASTLRETANLVDIANANAGSNSYLGALWMSGFGPAADAQGNVYFATGNGPFNGTTNFSMSVVKVPGNLNLSAATFFTPYQAALDSSADADLGSGGVVLLPDQSGSHPHLLVAGGKCSVNNLGCFKYVLDRDALGGQQSGNAGALWSGDTGGNVMGGPAYFVDATGAQHIVYGAGVLNTYDLNTSPAGLKLHTQTSISRSQPIVSSNGMQAGSAVAWVIKPPGGAGGTMSLYAFNPLDLSPPLFVGIAGSWLQAPGTSHIGGALVSPLVANGRVYVPTDGSVTVFGLLH